MTGELLNKGIDATKDINNFIMDMFDNEKISTHECDKMQKCLNTITDVLQECFVDMVKADQMKIQLESINKTLDEHLNKFQHN